MVRAPGPSETAFEGFALKAILGKTPQAARTRCAVYDPNLSGLVFSLA